MPARAANEALGARRAFGRHHGDAEPAFLPQRIGQRQVPLGVDGMAVRLSLIHI